MTAGITSWNPFVLRGLQGTSSEKRKYTFFVFCFSGQDEETLSPPSTN